MKNNKKGFTIVELVIVIAVIAILAAVLIPTFSNVIDKAKQSNALQTAKSKFEEIYALDQADGTVDGKDTTSTTNQNLVDGSYNVVYPVPGENETITYKTKDGAVEEFTFDNKTYKATYREGNWTTEKSAAAASASPSAAA